MRFDEVFQKWLENAPIIFISTLTAIYGLKTANRWSSEYVGKRKAILAEEILLAALEFENALQTARSPFVLTEEIADVSCNSPQSVRRVTIYLLKRHKEIFTDHVLRLKKKYLISYVYFDDKTHHSLRALLSIENDFTILRNEMQRAAQSYINNPEPKKLEQFTNTMNKYLETDDSDLVTSKTVSAIKDLKTKLTRHLSE